MTTSDPMNTLSYEEALRLARERVVIDEVMDPRACTLSSVEGVDTWTIHFEQPWAEGKKCDVILSKTDFEILAVTYGH